MTAKLLLLDECESPEGKLFHYFSVVRIFTNVEICGLKT